jgi:hypothetical protein
MANVTNAQLMNGQFRTKNFVSPHHIDTEAYSIALNSNYKKQLRLLTKRDTLLPIRKQDHQDDVFFNDTLSQKSNTNTYTTQQHAYDGKLNSLRTDTYTKSKKPVQNENDLSLSQMTSRAVLAPNRNGNSKSQQSMYISQHRLMHNCTTLSNNQTPSVLQYKSTATKPNGTTNNQTSVEQKQAIQQHQKKQHTLIKPSLLKVPTKLSTIINTPSSLRNVNCVSPQSSTVESTNESRFQFIQLHKPLVKINPVTSQRTTSYLNKNTIVEQKLTLFEKDKIRNDIKLMQMQTTPFDNTFVHADGLGVKKRGHYKHSVGQMSKAVNPYDLNLEGIKVKTRHLDNASRQSNGSQESSITSQNDAKKHDFMRLQLDDICEDNTLNDHKHRNSIETEHELLKHIKKNFVKAKAPDINEFLMYEKEAVDKCRTATIKINGHTSNETTPTTASIYDRNGANNDNNDESEDDDDYKSDSCDSLLSSSDRSCELIYLCPQQNLQTIQKQTYNNNNNNILNAKTINKLKPITESYHCIDSLSEINTVTSNEDGEHGTSKSRTIKDVKKNILNNLNKRLSAKSNFN